MRENLATGSFHRQAKLALFIGARGQLCRTIIAPDKRSSDRLSIRIHDRTDDEFFCRSVVVRGRRRTWSSRRWRTRARLFRFRRGGDGGLRTWRTFRGWPVVWQKKPHDDRHDEQGHGAENGQPPVAATIAHGSTSMGPPSATTFGRPSSSRAVSPAGPSSLPSGSAGQGVSLDELAQPNATRASATSRSRERMRGLSGDRDGAKGDRLAGFSKVRARDP